MANPVKVLVPDIGGFKDVDVIDVLVKDGQQIEKETPLITFETEKAAMDVPAPAAGRIAEVKVKKGDKVSEGSLILLLEGEADGAGAAPKPQAAADQRPAPGSGAGEQRRRSRRARRSRGSAAGNRSSGASKPARDEPRAPKAATPAKAAEAAPRGARAAAPTHAADPPRRPPRAARSIDEKAFSTAYASPSVRKFARELGADLGRIKGTGPKGRITHEDVKAHVKRLLTSRRTRARARGVRSAHGAAKSTSRNSVPSKSSRCRASSAFPARACRQAGSTCRT